MVIQQVIKPSHSRAKQFTSQQEKRIVRLLRKGVKVRDVSRRVSISRWSVYRIMDKHGIHNRQSRDDVEAKDEFVCPGFNHCVTCRRIFEFPCPLSS
jgi:hypothetical protein